jgi:hypothetical protein
MREHQLLQSAISEYESLLASMSDRIAQPVRSEDMIRELRRTHDWTDGGARAIVSLANDYGAFMLRNALALAVALGKEDGELGF